jgi:hypothetical protein
MKRELKKLNARGTPEISATLKWWRGMSGSNKNFIGVRGMIGHAKFMSDHKRLEKQYNLKQGETLGV